MSGPPIRTSASPGLARWLEETGCALALGTGADGRLVLVGVGADGGVSLFEQHYGPIGAVWARDNALLIASDFRVWRLENALAPGETAESYDRLYVPQAAYTTGDIGVGGVAIARNGAILMASRLFNCLALASDAYSFTPLWRPAFISDLVPEDRCHLTGMAVIDGAPRVVTVAAESNEAGAWTHWIEGGGGLIDVRSDEFVARGLSLPVAPRYHDGRLWLLEAATGWLGYIDPSRRAFEHVAFCPGLPRGLALVGDYAVCTVAPDTGLAGAGPLPVAASLKRVGIPPQCAVLIVDIRRGEIVEWLQLEEGADDIADVAILEGAMRPAAVGPDGADIRRVLSIAPERPRRRAEAPEDETGAGPEIGRVDAVAS